MRRVCVLAAAAAVSLLVLSGAGAAYGDPPRQCKDTYEAYSNHTCLLQSRAGTFTLSPHEVKAGETITATMTNTGAYDLVRVIWDSLTSTFGTGSRLCAENDVRLGKGKSSTCKFKVLRPTNAWVTVELGFGTTIGPAFSRDYYASSLTATPPPPTTTQKDEEKEPSISVSVRLAGDPVLGETTDGNLVVRAGEKPVGGISFVGAPLNLAGKAIQLVEKPKPPGSFSLSAGASRSFAFVVKGAAKGKATLSSSVRGTADGKTVSATTSLPVEVGESALLITLETSPEEFPLDVDDEGRVASKEVEVLVRLKNTTKKPLNRISVTGLFPQPVDPDSKADQLAFAKKLLPISVGTLAPGATFKRELPLVVTGDGEYRIRALAQYAESATSKTQSAVGLGGRFLATVPPLWFEASLEKTGLQSMQSASEGWVKAGGTALITGKVKNLSSTKTLCLGPLYAKKAGNAGGTGPVDITVYGPDAIAPPVAGKIGPKDDILIGLWVRTSVDGGTRGTIAFDPKAGIVGEDGTCYVTDPFLNPLGPKQIRVKKGSTEFTLHVDVKDPVFNATIGEILAEYYGGLVYGAAKGSADFFSNTFASVADMLSPQSLAKNALDPFYFYRGWALSIKTAELLAHYWQDTTPEQRKSFLTRVGAVFEKARSDAWKKTLGGIDSAVGEWMNKVAVAYARGDYATVARALGEARGYGTAQVVLNVATAELGNRIMAELPEAAAAFKEIGGTTRTYKTLRALPPGKLLNLRELQNLYGIAAEDLRKMAAIAKKHGVRIGVKGRSPEAIAHLRKGAVWKPEPIKPKNVNAIDQDWLGFKTKKGLVATKKFTAKEVQAIRERIAGSNLSFEQKQAVIERLGVRLGEEKYLKELQQFRNRGEIEVGKNYRDNGLSPEDAPFVSERRKFGLETTPGSPGEYNPKMAKAGSDKLEFITGDVDGLYLIAARGHALTAKQHVELLRDLWEAGWQHPETLTWIRNGEFEFAAKSKILGEHALGADAAMEIGPDGIARAVFIDLEKSLLFDQRAFWLDVVGGFVAR